MDDGGSGIPFEVFTKFERFEKASPLITVPPPDWAAALNNPKIVTKNPKNPVFRGSGEEWDAYGVREAEIFRDSDGLLTPQVFEAGNYYYMLYAGLNGDGWDKGHCVSGLARIPKKQ